MNIDTASGLNLTQYLFWEIRSDGSTTMPIIFLTVYGHFCAVIVKESGHIAPIYYLALNERSL